MDADEAKNPRDGQGDSQDKYGHVRPNMVGCGHVLGMVQTRGTWFPESD